MNRSGNKAKDGSQRKRVGVAPGNVASSKSFQRSEDKNYDTLPKYSSRNIHKLMHFSADLTMNQVMVREAHIYGLAIAGNKRAFLNRHGIAAAATTNTALARFGSLTNTDHRHRVAATAQYLHAVLKVLNHS